MKYGVLFLLLVASSETLAVLAEAEFTVVESVTISPRNPAPGQPFSVAFEGMIFACWETQSTAVSGTDLIINLDLSVTPACSPFGPQLREYEFAGLSPGQYTVRIFENAAVSQNPIVILGVSVGAIGVPGLDIGFLLVLVVTIGVFGVWALGTNACS